MRVLTVAKKDFRDAVQSRALWALVAVFVVVLLITTYGYVQVPELFGPTSEATFGGLIFFTLGITSLFIPLAALVVCYKSLAGEPDLGRMNILLSFPLTRSDAFFGKVLGRAGVLGVGLVVGLVSGLGFGAVLLGAVEVVPLVVFLLLTLAFVCVYSAIMVGLSATTGSTSRATTLAVGFFVLFELVWDVVPLAIVYVIEGFSLPAEFPDWVFLVTQVSPSTAYFTSIIALLPDTAAELGASIGGTGVDVEPTEADPFYVTPEAGLVFLVLWLVVALFVGYSRFGGSDL
jgi:ABC-2 type transport system permease protein